MLSSADRDTSPDAEQIVGHFSYLLLSSERIMILPLGRTFLFLLLLTAGVTANPNIVQSSVVSFPVNGRVIVQAREEPGKFPQMLFVSEKTANVLLLSSIEDADKWLIPEDGATVGAQPILRFRVIRSAGFSGPMVMSVGVFHGGSDNASFLTVFGEVDGKILRFNDKAPICKRTRRLLLGLLE